MSGGDWKTLDEKERREWLNAKGQWRTGPHIMKRRVCHWLACTRCGLVQLKNDVSRKAVSKPCRWEE